MTRLLILGCSQRKRPDPGLLPAIERYDGPPYRVLRRYLRQEPSAPPTVYILSAEFGLIPSDQPIPYYDRRMTVQRAQELQPAVMDALGPILGLENSRKGRPKCILVHLGKTYLLTFSEGSTRGMLRERAVTGPPGVRLAQLLDWLNNSSNDLTGRAATRKLPTSIVRAGAGMVRS